MRVRKLKIFTFIFMALVILAAYGLAWLRTYAFKPQPTGNAGPEIIHGLFVSENLGEGPRKAPSRLERGEA